MGLSNRVEIQAVLTTDSLANVTDVWETNRKFTFSIDGTFTGKIALQRSFNGGSTWKNIHEFQEEFEGICYALGDNIQYRMAITETGTSGAIIRVRN